MADPLVLVPFQIPLSPQQSQQLSVTIGATPYTLTFRWNGQAGDNGLWILDIADSSQNPILSGVPIVTGADLLEQFAYLGFSFYLVSQTTSDTDTPPTYDNLGTDGLVYALSPPVPA